MPPKTTKAKSVKASAAKTPPVCTTPKRTRNTPKKAPPKVTAQSEKKPSATGKLVDTKQPKPVPKDQGRITFVEGQFVIPGTIKRGFARKPVNLAVKPRAASEFNFMQKLFKLPEKTDEEMQAGRDTLVPVEDKLDVQEVKVVGETNLPENPIPDRDIRSAV